MTYKTPGEFIREKIRKYKQYERLLDDPDFVKLLPELQALVGTVDSKNQFNKNQLKLPVTAPKKKAGRKPGPLVEKAESIVNNAMREVSAKDVLSLLEKSGIQVEGKDKAIKVSKVLRQLAAAGKISARSSGPSKKAAILYRANTLSLSFPVQGIVITQ